MASWDDVSRIALSLPEAIEVEKRGNRVWTIKEKYFVWERPLRASDRVALGDAAPGGPILGARVEHELAKRALIEDDPNVFFTTPHFDGYPAVLIQLDHISEEILREVVIEAWLARAPKRLAERFNPS